MGKINSVKYAALQTLTGMSSGPLNSLEYVWLLQETGKSGGTLPGLRHTFMDLQAVSANENINSRWYEYLGNEGYTEETLPERLNHFWSDGGPSMASTTTTITAAQLADSYNNGTVIDVVPAPGANKIAQVIHAMFAAPDITAGESVVPGMVWYGGDLGQAFAAINDPATIELNSTDSYAASVGYGAEAGNGSCALARVVNLPISLYASAAVLRGAIETSAIGAAGIDYEADDEVTIGDATITILTVDTGGEVLTYEVTDPGTEIFIANGQAVTGGTGTGFEIDVTALDYSVNPMELKVKVIYSIFNLEA